MEPGSPYQAKPAVLTWYAIYCWAMVALYILCFVAGVAVLVLPAETFDMEPVERISNGVVFAGMGLVLTAVFVVGALIPPKKWGWIYGIVMIAVGMTSCCCLPVCIPLLIYWIKPDVKAWFGMT